MHIMDVAGLNQFVSPKLGYHFDKTAINTHHKIVEMYLTVEIYEENQTNTFITIR